MLYAVAGLFLAITMSSLILSLPLLYIQDNYWTNFTIVFLCGTNVWLYFDNLSLLYDIEGRKNLRQNLMDIIHTIEMLKKEREEIYRDIRLIRKIKYKETMRHHMIKSASCKF